MVGGHRIRLHRCPEPAPEPCRTDQQPRAQLASGRFGTDVAETLGALSDLVHQGKIRYIGSSSYSGSQIVEAQRTSRERNLERFVAEQPPYSIMVRGIEEDVLPTVRCHGMGTLTYSPLAGGWLSGRYRKDASSGPASAARPQALISFSGSALSNASFRILSWRRPSRVSPLGITKRSMPMLTAGWSGSRRSSG